MLRNCEPRSTLLNPRCSLLIIHLDSGLFSPIAFNCDSVYTWLISLAETLPLAWSSLHRKNSIVKAARISKQMMLKKLDKALLGSSQSIKTFVLMKPFIQAY